jgi:hypothetical protein
LLGSATYNTGVNAATNVNLTSSMIKTISALVAHSNANANNDAAIQIAIWTTEYGNKINFTGDAGMRPRRPHTWAMSRTALGRLRPIKPLRK